MSTQLEHLKTVICVKNFSKCGDKEFLEFDLIDQNELELIVKIYPCVGEFISIYVARETAKKPFSAEEMTCRVSVIDKKGTQCFTQSFTFYNLTKEDVFIFGWKQCFNRACILDFFDEFIPDDKLNLQFDFTYKGRRVSKPILNAGKTLKKLSESFRSNHELQKNPLQLLLDLPTVIPDVLKSIGYYITDFLNINQEWITVETMHGIKHRIQFKDGIETLGSKLCAASPVFSRILKSPMQEKENKKVKIIDFDAATFSTFLRYIDSGKINWTKELEYIYSLYEMADKYEVLNLMKECSNYLVKNINTDNVIDIARLATMHSDHQLKEAVVSFCIAKETWLVEKLSTLVLKEVSEKVKLKQTVPRNITADENRDYSSFQKEQVVLLRRYEDACILYAIADEFNIHDMMMDCAKYMKHNINPENARIALSYIKQYRNHSYLYFVKTYLKEHINKDVEEAFGRT